MTNIVNLHNAARQIESTIRSTYNGGNGGEPPMELIERVGRLEADMSTVKTDVAVIRSNYATREDMHKEFNLQTWRIIGAILAAGGLIFAAVRLMP